MHTCNVHTCHNWFLFFRTSCQNLTNLTNITFRVILQFEYPYRETSYVVSYEPERPEESENITECTIVKRQVFSGSAEYFVAISSMSFIFGILTIPFYIIFYVPRYDLAKYLSIIVSIYMYMFVSVKFCVYMYKYVSIWLYVLYLSIFLSSFFLHLR